MGDHFLACRSRVVGLSREAGRPSVRDGGSVVAILRGGAAPACAAVARLALRTPLSETLLTSPGSSPSAFHRVFLKERPSIDMPAGACPTVLSNCSCWVQRAPGVFRPRGFSPPRRLAPPTASWACCIPLPILGFIGFRCARGGWPAARIAHPLRCTCPPELSPPAAAGRASPRDPCPLAVLRAETRSDLEALLRRGVRCAGDPLPVRRARGSPGLPFLADPSPSPTVETGRTLRDRDRAGWWTDIRTDASPPKRQRSNLEAAATSSPESDVLADRAPPGDPRGHLPSRRPATTAHPPEGVWGTPRPQRPQRDRRHRRSAIPEGIRPAGDRGSCVAGLPVGTARDPGWGRRAEHR